MRADIPDRGGNDPPLVRLAADRGGYGMFGLRLQPRGKRQEGVFRPLKRDDVGH
jgi:hypothetical protein